MLDYQHKAIDHMITKIKGVNEVIVDIKTEQNASAESKIKRQAPTNLVSQRDVKRQAEFG
jgi:hypothetical protein